MKFTVYCDGGSRGNPGPAAVGGVIRIEEEVIGTYSHTMGIATNNEAEYTAVISALEWITNYSKSKGKEGLVQVNFYVDSKLIANQLSGNYKIKQDHLKELALKVFTLLSQLKGKATYTYIPREKNHQADSLVNQALDTA